MARRAAELRDLARTICEEASPAARELAGQVRAATFAKGQTERHLKPAELEALLLATLWKFEHRAAPANRAELAQAVARLWCEPEHSAKEMDAAFAASIVNLIERLEGSADRRRAS